MPEFEKGRSASRYVSERPLEAKFSAGMTSFPVVVRDLSVSGAQIEHANELRPSTRGLLSVGKITAPAVVIWTRMAVPGVYRSGVRLDARTDVASEIRDLLADGTIHAAE